MKDKPYPGRLKELKLDSLEFRRKRADALQCFRIMKQIDQVDESHFFTRSQESRTRSNGAKLFKTQRRTKIRANAFSHRVVDNWNDLPEEVISAPSINSFKSRLRKVWKNDPDRLLS